MDNINNTPTNKHLFSLTAILFFAPAVPFVLKGNNYGLSEQDKLFVKGYIKLGFIILFIFGVSIGLYILSYFFGGDIKQLINFNILLVLGNILTWIGIGFIISGIFMIFSDKEIFQTQTNLNFNKVRSGNFGLIKNYIPLLNFYLWYMDKREINNYWWIKESIFIIYLWIIFGLIGFGNPVLINLLFVVFILVRTGSLLGGIDFIQDKYKEKIDNLFDNNPEEIISPISGFLKFIIGKLSKNKKSYEEFVNNDKLLYSRIVEKENNLYKDNVVYYTQYFLLLFVTITYIIYIRNEIIIKISAFFYLMPFILLIGKYGINLYTKKMNPIPFLFEFSKKIVNLLNIIK